jgi:hypothetical protein
MNKPAMDKARTNASALNFDGEFLSVISEDAGKGIGIVY